MLSDVKLPLPCDSADFKLDILLFVPLLLCNLETVYRIKLILVVKPFSSI